MNTTPSISVIIPARDAAPTLQRTLLALREQTFQGQFEVIVVDDGSADETASIAERHAPLVTLVRSERSEGPGAARNRGVRAARAPVLAFTDSDCFPTPQWLAEGLGAIAEADLVQGAVAPDPATARTPFDRTVKVDGENGFYQTANLLVTREAFEAVGGFRDWLLQGARERRVSADRRRRRATRTPIGEDTLFGWSARRRGIRSSFAPTALVHHAVVPGDLGDEIADRWHWACDMPGLARMVPELRRATFYRTWFFHRRTARLDVAVAGLAAMALTRRRACLLALVPYCDWVVREAVRWPGRDSVSFALGSVVADLATLAGLVKGSVVWRSVLV